MGEVVNLNKFRKQKARAEKEAAAAENRVRHGQTKAEKRATEDDKARREQHLDGAEREPRETTDE
ncbi:MAG: DUF4169 family protein [Pseudomonadota bacterium]